jgi:hypothetical protein
VKSFHAAAFLALIGCVATDETSAPDEGIAEGAVTGLTWLREPQGCATDIAVSPDDTIWVIGCDANPDGSIWHMRLEGDFAQSPVWTETNGRAKRVSVDNGGEAWVTTNSGAAYRAMLTTIRTEDSFGRFNRMLPTGEWTPWGTEPVGEGGYLHFGLPNSWFTRAPKSGSTKSVDLLFNHQESVLVFHSPTTDGHCTYPTVGCYFYVNNDPLAFGSYEFGRYGAHEAYELLSNGTVLFKKTPQPSRIPVVIPPPNNLWKTSTTEWLATSITDAKAMALFTPPSAQFYSRLLWTVNSSGAMKMFDPTLPNFSISVASPPSKTTSLTDHYALAADGVYQYGDSNQSWAYYLPNTTATGTIVKLAHSRKQNARGQSYTSAVWAIDNTGAIYRSGFNVVIH